MVECKLCQIYFKNFISLSKHIVHSHKISSKDYFDKFMKLENEGECPFCSKETKYRGLGERYTKTCSHKCSGRNKEFLEKQSKSSKLLWSDKQYRTRQMKTFTEERKTLLSKKIREKFKDPKSKYNSSDWKKKQSKIQKDLRKDPYSIFNSEEWKKKQSISSKEFMSSGGASYVHSFIESTNQEKELFLNLQEIFSNSILQYPEKLTNSTFDCAIPNLMLAIELDGGYHCGKQIELDEIRQQKNEKLGWIFIRYNKVATIEELKLDIKCVLQRKIDEIKKKLISRFETLVK